MKNFIVISFLAATSLMAAPITWNFEDQSVTTGLSSATSTVGGVTLTVTRQGGATFGFEDLSTFMPAATGWGARSLSPFENTNAGTALVLSFSAALSSFSIQVGDFDADSDTWSLAAFDAVGGAGTNIGNANGTWGLGDISAILPQTGSITAAGIRSVVLVGGGTSFPMSLYWDNAIGTVSGVPEPATWLMMAAGCAMLVAFRKRAQDC